MSTIAENLQRIQTAKADIASAIIEKGGEVSGRIENYGEAIRNLPGGQDDSYNRIIELESTGPALSGIAFPWEEINCGDMRTVNVNMSFRLMTGLFRIKMGNWPNCAYASRAFNGGQYTSIEIGDCPVLTDTRNMFDTARELVSLKLGDFSAATLVANMFYDCSKLENVTFSKTCAVSFSLAQSPLLTIESLRSIINALPSVATSQTLTLHATAKARLTAEDIAIATAKNWVIA